MADNNKANTLDMPEGPNTKLKELTERLTGRWRVTGPGIEGEAEYISRKEGFLLILDVDFVSDGTKIKSIQHITYDQETDTLRSHYIDTMGDDSVYTWVLAGQKIRVSQGGKDSDTYFEATLNDDNTRYTGTWHYPDTGDSDATAEQIEYKKIKE